MNKKEKEFDCVKFKQKLFENALKVSGAKNLDEYVDYVNAHYTTSPLYKAAVNA
ncbi:MAG: hypothetical protein LBK68_05460 [Candidatus Margulisbacteria bacterium]|jgi:hypothetical protein|nr:hypothetical protein [Candidatus Margulisiibacteriota bacterium]